MGILRKSAGISATLRQARPQGLSPAVPRPGAEWVVFLSCHWGRQRHQAHGDRPVHMKAHRLAPSPSAESRPKAAAPQRAAPTARRFGRRGRLASISRGFGRHKALSPAGGSPPRGPALHGLAGYSNLPQLRLAERRCVKAHRFVPSPSAESRPKAAAHRWAAPTARRFGCTLRLAWVSFGHCRHKPLSLRGRSPPRGPALRGFSLAPSRDMGQVSATK